jgi:hypothetical protein
VGRRSGSKPQKKAAKEAGVTIKEVLWVQREYDFAAITEANDEIAATAFGLNIAKQGNVRAVTMRFPPEIDPGSHSNLRRLRLSNGTLAVRKADAEVVGGDGRRVEVSAC